MRARLPPFALDFPPFRPSGVVVGALLNDPREIAALGKAADAAPYRGAPKAPVLAVKPPHAFLADGGAVTVPADVDALAVRVNLGLLIGRAACRVPAALAAAHVAGYVLVAEAIVPPTSHYRPALRLRARDRACVFASRAVPASVLTDPDAATPRIEIDTTACPPVAPVVWTRGVNRLVADVSAFMTLAPGDVLLLGSSHDGAVHARAGQRVRVDMPAVGALAFTLVAGAESA